jgi:hypothetical protein
MGVDDWKRSMRALGRQVDDPEALAQAVEIAEYLDTVLLDAARRLLDKGDRSMGYSYTDLGRALGITRQGARKRFPLAGDDTEAVA